MAENSKANARNTTPRNVKTTDASPNATAPTRVVAEAPAIKPQAPANLRAKRLGQSQDAVEDNAQAEAVTDEYLAQASSASDPNAPITDSGAAAEALSSSPEAAAKAAEVGALLPAAAAFSPLTAALVGVGVLAAAGGGGGGGSGSTQPSTPTAAELAATAATTAADAATKAKTALDAAVTALGTPATPAQLADVETKQATALTAATAATTAATAATAAATAAAAAATAANEATPASVATANAAATTATTAATAANAAAGTSESATDAKVLVYANTATSAANAATTAATTATNAANALDAAVAALSTPPTPAQLADIQTKQAAAQAAANDATAKATAATAAASSTSAAATAAIEVTPASVAAANDAATAATAAAAKANASIAASTGGQLAYLAQVAADAATAATTAASTANTAKTTLDSAVAALGTPATPAQLLDVETKQTAAIAAATAATNAATAATTAATAAHNAAVAASVADPASVIEATNAATAATTAATAATTAAGTSESATDTKVAALATAASTAATAATNAATAATNAKTALDAAVTALGTPATPTQLADVETKQAAALTAATAATNAATAATAAATAAAAAATAANEATPASVATANAAATTATTAATAANAAAGTSESATDAKVLVIANTAISAANAATTAATTANNAKTALDTAVAALGTPATPAQLADVETKQAAALTAATAATNAATAATTAATAAAAAATAAGEATPASVATANSAATTATAAATAATNAATASETATDAKVAVLAAAATTAATGATNAATTANNAKTALDAAVTALGTPATPTQLRDVETKQITALSLATAATAAATAATAAATAAAAAATAAGEATPASVATANSAAGTATTAATNANAAAVTSESATDAKVLVYANTATSAANAATTAATTATNAANALDAAVAALSTPPTPAQLANLQTLKDAAQAAANDATAKATAATAAASSTSAAATAAIEVTPASVAAANTAATAATVAAAKAIASIAASSTDTTPPSAPTIDPAVTPAKVNLDLATSEFDISGTGEAGATVTLTFSSGRTLVGGNTTVVAPNGAWSVRVTKADVLAFGELGETITARQADAANNISGPATHTLSVDTVLPTAQLNSTGILLTNASAVVQSSEKGKAYLVRSSATITSEQDILDLQTLDDASVNTVAINTVNTNTNLALTGLLSGTYTLYTADAFGNLSAATSTLQVAAPIAQVSLVNVGIGSGGFVIRGELANDNSGWCVSDAGDVNGDGLSDVLVGAYGLTSSVGNGKTYVVFGKTTTSAISLADIASGTGNFGYQINPEAMANNIGMWVTSVGDVNGDGLADLMVGATAAGTNGKAYVVFGKASNTAINLATVAAGGTNPGGFAIVGDATNTLTGAKLSNAGDVNGDGLQDLLVSAFGSSKAYVVYGQTGTATINLATVATGVGGYVINNITNGSSISTAGDVNGDGYADLVVGAANSNKAFVVYGQSTPSTISMTNVAAGTGGFQITGATISETGYSVANAGDVNGDGYADLIVGARAAGSLMGKSYVVFGQAANTTVNLATLALGGANAGGFVINGSASSGASGYSVSSAGDINGDGLADLIVGAPTANSWGVSYVVYGKTDTTAIDLANVFLGIGGFAIAAETNQFNGVSVTSAGDVNGDGYADLLVGAYKTTSNAGTSYVIFGGKQFASDVNPIDFLGTTGADTLTGNATTVTAETFMAGEGNDVLTGNGGADVMNGGKGNDTFILNTSNLTALASNMGAGGNTTQLAMVNGGGGFDSLQLVGGAALNLTQVSNVDAMAGSGTSRISSVERIDMGTDTSANTLTLSDKDVNDMAGMNLIHTTGASADGKTWTNVGTGTALADVTTYHQLVVDGTSVDKVTFAASTGIWKNAGTVNNGADNYVVWQNADTHSQVLVKSVVAVDGKAELAPLSLTSVEAGNNGFVINGGSSVGLSGYSISHAGDVNGDGLDDVIVGAYNESSQTGNASAGNSYVVFGRTGGSPIDLAAIATGSSGLGFQIQGNAVRDWSGYAVSAAGDINGDGLADLLVGAPTTNAPSTAAASYVVYGQKASTAINLSAVAQGVGGFIITDSAQTRVNLGRSVSNVGDVNGDGWADFVIAEPGLTSAGSSSVVFGKANMGAVDLATVAAGGANAGGFVMQGAVVGDRTGTYVSGAGDVNGDGLADMLVSSYYTSTTGLGKKSYVVFGKTDTTAINLGTVAAGGANAGGFAIDREAGGTYAELNISNAGDVNGDGLADLIVGDATSAGNTAGKSFVVFGKTNTTQVSLATVAAGGANAGGFVINGEVAGDFSANVSNAGDVNGDGLADLIVGGSGANGGLGRMYVVFGKTDNAAINLADVAMGKGGVALNGELTGATTGANISAAGDVNGDGFADLMVSAYNAYVGGTLRAGKTYVIFGGPQSTTFAKPVDFVGTTGADTQTGNATTATAETFMAGDGNDTLIGNGGADVMNGGKGNDTFTLNASNLTALASAMGTGGNTTQLAMVNGGGGFDTLRLAAAATALNLTQVSNVDAMSGSGTSRISSIERIDMATDTGVNTLTLAGKDVNDMAAMNLVHTTGASADGKTWTNVGTGAALANITTYHQLVVDGGSNDVVSLKTNIGAWTNVGQVNDGTTNYDVLQNVGTQSQLIVKSGLSMYDISSTVAGSTTAPMKLNLLGSAMSLDLSAFTAQSERLSEVDVSGTGANTLKINLSDVLSGSPTAKLTVNGNADDFVTFSNGVWTLASTTTANGHNYDVYNATGGSAAQLLVDHVMHINYV